MSGPEASDLASGSPLPRLQTLLQFPDLPEVSRVPASPNLVKAAIDAKQATELQLEVSLVANRPAAGYSMYVAICLSIHRSIYIQSHISYAFTYFIVCLYLHVYMYGHDCFRFYVDLFVCYKTLGRGRADREADDHGCPEGLTLVRCRLSMLPGFKCLQCWAHAKRQRWSLYGHLSELDAALADRR